MCQSLDFPKAEPEIRTWGRLSYLEGDSASRHEKVGRLVQGRRIAPLERWSSEYLFTSSFPHWLRVAP